MKNKVLVIIVLISLTIVALFYASNTKKEIDTNYEAIRKLEIRKSDILLELDSNQREYDLKIHGASMVFMLFTDFDTKYYDDIIELFEDRGYYGTLVLSKDNFPSKEGYLSIEQFNNLIKKGWNYCILYDNAEQFDYLKKLFDVNGMKTDTVYFNKGKYSKALDEYMKDLGFKSIVHHGEEGLNMYKDTLNNGIWHVGSMGLYGSSPRAKLIDTIENHGAFVYTIGFDKKNKEEYIDLETFDSALDAFNGFIYKQTLKVTDLERGLVYLKEIQKKSDKNKEEYNKLKTELETELKDIENKIKELER